MIFICFHLMELNKKPKKTEKKEQSMLTKDVV